MATFKDISLLTQKVPAQGTEKIPISNTEYLNTAQIAALASPYTAGANISIVNRVISTNIPTKQMANHPTTVAGTYSSVTVDINGCVTKGSNTSLAALEARVAALELAWENRQFN